MTWFFSVSGGFSSVCKGFCRILSIPSFFGSHMLVKKGILPIKKVKLLEMFYKATRWSSSEDES